MPTSTHPDHGKMRLLSVEDCPECGGFDTFRIEENDYYQFETCRQCGYETASNLETQQSI